MLLWIYFGEATIYGEESPYFDNFFAKQRFDSAYKDSFSILDKLEEFIFQSVQEILSLAFALPEKRSDIFSVLGFVASRLRTLRNIFPSN